MYDTIEKIYRERLISQIPILRDDDIQLQYILNYLSKNKNISNLAYENISAIDLFKKIETDSFYYQQSSIDSLAFKKDSFDFYKNILEKNGFEIILQNGYKSSCILYPFYSKLTRVFDKVLNIKLPLVKKTIEISNNIIKSEISYHSIFIATKIYD